MRFVRLPDGFNHSTGMDVVTGGLDEWPEEDPESLVAYGQPPVIEETKTDNQ